MGYDMTGKQYAALPTGVPGLHVVMCANPNVPGLLQRHFYVDPINGNKDVELASGQDIGKSVAALSGMPISFLNGHPYWDRTSGKTYPYPKVLLEDGVPGSGLNGVAYPYNYGG
jgi:hypothetical protein